MSAERILVDTSVWIDYFRNQSAGFVDFVAELVKNHEICVPQIVLAELMQGAKSEKELSVSMLKTTKTHTNRSSDAHVSVKKRVLKTA